MTEEIFSDTLDVIFSSFLRRYYTLAAFKGEYSEYQDQIAERAYKESLRLREKPDPEDFLKRHKHKFNLAKPMFVAEFPPLLWRSTLIICVSCFEFFLVDSIRAVLRYQPDSIKNNCKSAIDPVECQISKVDTFHKRFELITKMPFNIQLHFPETEPPEPSKEDQLYEIHATRNLLVHNMGIVSQRYYNARGFRCYEVGQERPIDNDYVNTSLNTLYNVAGRVWLGLRERFAPEQLNNEIRQHHA
ncbi:MAG: hypothetical protein HY913_02580 [Desulfomonile tiedjei]|nr:hypothetical protein [Desulfomonile tiedjei]